MGQEEILQRIQENNKRGEELVKFIQNELALLKNAAAERFCKNLETELSEKNLQLKKELEYWKNKVVELEIMNGITQYTLPTDIGKIHIVGSDIQNIKEEEVQKINKPDNKTSLQVVAKNGVAEGTNDDKKMKKAKAVKPEKQSATPKSEKQPTEDKEINVSRLDLRIGRILTAKKHPDAESLYVEEIDVGEEKPRTVVSGLVKYVPLEEMQNRLVVVLCNLKPAKMRGITSEAMVMCASTPDKVEILCPPADSVPGDRVVCDKYPGEPDPILPPKKKIFEQVAPDLKTDANCI
ncbi:Aminoacyl tRNA synthase complex-interacting multifunctional protein 1, partial [Stegodyphus mimosarum]